MNDLAKLGKTRTILILISILLVSIHTIYFYHSIRPEIETKKLIQQWGVYDLFEQMDTNTYSIYIFNTLVSYTSQIYTGKLTITKLDPVNQIVSGTFWYNIQDTYGVVHHITDGRFDMQFTQ